LGFHRAVKGIDKNETLEVVMADERRVIVRNQRGEERTVTGKQARCFDVFDRRPFEVAGDRRLMTANRRQAGFRATNGEIVRVDHVDPDGRIGLDDGRVVPRDYTHVAYGYAVTAHRSQGKTVDAVIVSGDGMRKELFYVAASRGRESVTVITSDVESLRVAVASSTARQSATELARKALVRVDRGVRRGLAAARELVRYASRTTVAAQSAEGWQEPRAERVHERRVGR
jgi:ATP-dependent exoDNAse (exonuclease V) alpha subunit